MCSVPTKKQATRTMSAPAPASYNPTQTTPFEVKIELMNIETDGSGRHFGFFKLTTIPFPEGHKKSGNYRVHIALDVSTSMREENRLGLAKDTTAKMVEFLASTSKENPELNFWFTLTTFSTDARVVINNSKVSEDTVRLITSAVQMIRPENSTNFEASFNLDRKIMEQQAAADQEAGNTVTTLHIVMTDGEVTAGNNNEDELKGMLCNNVEHVFIGYGAGHKAACLMNLASVNEKSSYLFLDHPTKMGAMFAQIFCPHLFTSISDVEIELTGAKFLDIESGLEVETLFVKRIAADTTKTFHLMTDPRVDAVHYADGDEDRHRVKEIYVRMQFRSFDNADLDEPPNFPFCKPYSVISATTHSLDVQKERKRWAVLVLMKDAKELKKSEQAFHQMMATSHWSERDQKQNGFKEERDALIHRATELKDEIKEFAEQNGIADDEMLKDLTTDLVICICAIPSHEHGLMYINSRFRSCTDETPTAVSDLTPLDDHVQDFLNSSGYNCGDDQLYSCGGDNDDALHRRRSTGAANAAYDNMARVMSQPSQPLSQEPPIQRRNSSYRQQQQQQQQPPFLSDDVNDNYHHNDDDSFSNSSHVVITNDNYDVEPCSDDVPTRR
uniref:VWFA domain-containing protein n=1 Tax=viral metagenome TaxID=1070528 RepID=A0A6C0F0Q0_9ZZZZ